MAARSITPAGMHDVRKFTPATSTVTTVLIEAEGVLLCAIGAPPVRRAIVEADCPEFSFGPTFYIGEGTMFVAASSKIFVFGGLTRQTLNRKTNP